MIKGKIDVYILFVQRHGNEVKTKPHFNHICRVVAGFESLLAQ